LIPQLFQISRKLWVFGKTIRETAEHLDDKSKWDTVIEIFGTRRLHPPGVFKMNVSSRQAPNKMKASKMKRPTRKASSAIYLGWSRTVK
jgi:hypothetical protein